MKKRYFITFLVFLLVGFSFGQSIFDNPITDPDPSLANPFIAGQVDDPNLIATGIGRGIGIGPNTGMNRYNARGWDTAVFDNTAYFEFTLTPNAGFEIDFVDFVYTGQASLNGPTNILLRSSLDGFVADIGVPLINGSTMDLSAPAYQNIATPITFRIYTWGASAPEGTFSIDDFTFSGTVVPNCTLTTTWDGIAWVPAVPDNTYAVVIDANYNTDVNGGSIDACSLTVNADLNINGTNYVQVTNDITINNGDIIVASEANLVQISDVSTVTLAGTGVGIVQKATTIIDDYYDYTYWSSPFTNETIGSALMGVPANRIFTYEAANFDDFDNDDFDDTPNDWIVAGQLDDMTPGKGYAAIADAIGMLGIQRFTFDGQFNNGVINPSITVSPDVADVNWNFLGNPYPSGVDLDAFLTHPDNSGLIGTVYLWTHVTPADIANPGNEILNFSVDDYASYNILGGTEATNDPAMNVPIGILASGQGFFIEAMQTAPATATFNNAMRVTTGNDNFYRATDRIWLNLENDLGAFSQILIGFVEGATDGVDRLYDGKRLDGGSLISFSSLIDDESYAIQGRVPLTEEEIVPLAIKNLVEGDNGYKISIENVEGLLETSETFLIDNLMNITHDLNSGEYRFSSEQGVYKDRFELILKNNLPLAKLIAEELIIIKNQDDSLSFATTNSTAIQNIQIFDVLGRLLFNQDFTQEESPNSIKFDQLKQTIFIAKATLANGKVFTKKGLK